MSKTTIITLFLGLFSTAAYIEGLAFGEQLTLSFEEIRQQIKPAADILLDWNRAQTESIDESKQQIAAVRERIERERQNRAAEEKQRLDSERRRQEEILRGHVQRDVQKFDVELKSVIINLRDERLKAEAEGIQKEINRLLGNGVSASQIEDSLIIQRNRLKSIEKRQAELNKQANEKERQEEAERLAEEAYWNSPEGRAEREMKAREAAAQQRMKMENRQRLLNAALRFL